MISALALGDLHLGKKRLHNLFGSNTDQMLLDEVRIPLNWARSNKIKEIFLLGDICDSETLPDKAELGLYELFHKYSDLNFRLILGNHDREQKDIHSLCKLKFLSDIGSFSNVWVYEEPTVVYINNIPVEFLPWPHNKGQLDNSIKIAHLERGGALRDNGGCFPDEGVTYDDRGVWLVGHLHTAQTVGKWYYPGTLYQTSFGERPDKGFIHIKARLKDDNLEYKIRKIKHSPQFKLLTLIINNVNEIKIDDRPSYKYRVILGPEVELPYDMMKKHPNIIELKVAKDKKELQDLLIPEKVIYALTDGLPFYLKELGFKKHHIKKARRWVKMAQMNIEE